MKKLSHILFLAILVPALSHGEEHKHRATEKARSGIVELSPELRKLLSREMLQLQDGMTKILPLYVAGSWSEIAVIAGQMESSYVLKKSLSNEQKEELHSKLPGAFVELDRRFHYSAGMLAHAAEVEKAELVGFYFSQMNEMCVTCHSQYATHRFPALALKKQAHEH